MVKIRLRRMGAKKQPSYRVVVTDSRSPRDGRFLEIIGRYDPRTDPPTVLIREDRALYWLSVGAQPTDAVAAFFRKLDLEAKVKKVHGGEGIDTLAGGQVRVSGPAEAPPKEDVPKRVRSVPEKGPSRRTKAGAAPADEPAADAAEDAPTAKSKAAPAEVAEAAAPAKEKVAEPAATVPEAVAEPEAEAVVEPEPETVAEPEGVAEPEAETVAEPEAVAEPEPEPEPKAVAKPEAAAESAATDLDSLGLPARVVAALQAAGVSDVASLRTLNEQGENALLDLPGIGAKAVDEIRSKLGS